MVLAPQQLTAIMDGTPLTRTAYTDKSGVLSASWAAEDFITVSPSARSYYSTTYKVKSVSGSSAQFEVYSGGTRYNSDVYPYYYPGDQIKNDIQFMNFTYDGQVQKKSNPTAHMGKFHSMRKLEYSMVDEIDFTGADQSACIKFNLSGLTFKNPSHISMMCLRGGAYQAIFSKNNYLSSYYTDSGSYNGIQQTSTLDMGLEGYGSVTSLTAYMMMSNRNVELKSGDILRIFVTCDDGTFSTDVTVGSNMTLQGGHFHTLTAKGGWMKDNTLDFKTYDFDGEVVTLQQGSGTLDLVIMGDGFIAEDIQNGTYESIMKQAYNEFFELQPFTYFKKLFNVYYVKAVSPQRIQATPLLNGATGDTGLTKFSTAFAENSTSVSGNNDLISEWAKKAFTTNANERIKNATIVVMANIEARAGTCHNQWYSNNGKDYGEAQAIAFCALGHDAQERKELMHHEICGHGFGKLADEYYYYTSDLSSSVMNKLKEYHTLGLYRNVDCYVDDYLLGQLGGDWQITTKSNVYWSDMFNTVNKYESASVESLGVFEGAYTYSFGFCRPTEDGSRSIMNGNTGIFNAISRRQIFYRIRSLSGQNVGTFTSPSEYKAFLDWDAKYFIPTMQSTRASSDYVSAPREPMAPPVLVSGTWLDGHFVPAEQMN